MSRLKSYLMTGVALLGLATPVAAQSLGAGISAGAETSAATDTAHSSVGAGVDARADAGVDSSLQTGASALASGSTVAESTTVVAQDGNAQLGNSDTTGSAQAGAMTSTKVGALIGLDVASATGEDIGEIDDVVTINGETMAVVGVGGFLGLGEHDVALPVTELSFEGNSVTALGYTRDQLESMAEYNADIAISLDVEQVVTLGRS